MTVPECTLNAYQTLKATSAAAELIKACKEEYKYIHYFKLYVKYLQGKEFVLLLLAALIIPIAFLNMKMCADGFLATSLVRVQKKFKISPLIAAFTLIPLANGAPDIIVTFINAQTEGSSANIAIGSLMSSFVFASTMVVAYVVFCSKEQILKVPAPAVTKEIGFSAIAYVLVSVFGVIGTTQRFYCIAPLLVYGAYIAVSIYMAKNGEKEGEEEVLAELSGEMNSAVYESFWQIVRAYLYDSSDVFMSIITMPFKAIYLVTVPSVNSPFFGTPIEYFVLALGTSFFVVIMEIARNILVIALVAISVALLVFLLFRALPAAAAHKVFVFDVFTILLTISWLKFYSSLLIDSINFVAFVLGVGKTFISLIILSLGNTTSDFFANGALAGAGQAVMAFIGCLASQLSNFLIGTAIFIFFSKKGEFDIFGLKAKTLSRDKTLLVLICLFAFGSMACLTTHVWLTRACARSYIYIAISLYVSFVAATALYSFLPF